MVQDTSQQQGPQTLTDGPIILQLTQENSRSQPGQRPQGNWLCQIRRYNRFKPTNSDLSVYIPASISVQQIPGHILALFLLLYLYIIFLADLRGRLRGQAEGVGVVEAVNMLHFERQGKKKKRSKHVESSVTQWTLLDIIGERKK